MLLFMRLRFQLARHVLLHGLGVGRDLRIEIIIGGELLRPNECTIIYASTGRDTFHLVKATCERCDANREQLRSAEDPQLQFNAILGPRGKPTPRLFIGAICTTFP